MKLNVIATKCIRIYLILVLIFSTKISFSQVINDFFLEPIESIEIPKSTNNKINVFVFLKNENVNSSLLSKSLDNYLTIIDFDTFNVFRINMTEKQVCVPGKYIKLDDWEFSGYPVFTDYIILVNTDNENYSKIVKRRIDAKELNGNSIDFRNADGKTPFIAYKDKNLLFKLICSPKDTVRNAKYHELKSLEQKLEQKIRDDREKEEENIKINSNKKIIITLNYGSPSFTFVSKSGLKGGGAYMENINSNNFNFNCNAYPFINNRLKKIGFGLGIGYTSFSAQLGINNDKAFLVDTLGRTLDKDGDPVNKIAYGSQIKENFSLNTMNLQGQIGYKNRINSKVNGFFAINIGFKFSKIVSSSYNATYGQMSWAGYYNNTLIMTDNDNYGYYRDESVFKGNKNLILKNSYFSMPFSIESAVAPLINLPNFYLNFNLYNEFGSNVLKFNQNESTLSSDPNNYNSLLYRANKLKINSWGLKYGISYAF
jgi:hypothetical protein